MEVIADLEKIDFSGVVGISYKLSYKPNAHS